MSFSRAKSGACFYLAVLGALLFIAFKSGFISAMGDSWKLKVIRKEDTPILNDMSSSQGRIQQDGPVVFNKQREEMEDSGHGNLKSRQSQLPLNLRRFRDDLKRPQNYTQKNGKIILSSVREDSPGVEDSGVQRVQNVKQKIMENIEKWRNIQNITETVIEQASVRQSNKYNDLRQNQGHASFAAPRKSLNPEIQQLPSNMGVRNRGNEYRNPALNTGKTRNEYRSPVMNTHNTESKYRPILNTGSTRNEYRSPAMNTVHTHGDANIKINRMGGGHGAGEPAGMVFYDGSGNRVVNHDKWIVVTSINPPTKDILALSQVPGWKLVVIGDTKTPTDWKAPNVVYLDVQTQAKLGLKIFEHLPYKSYSRKNIGYLFALKHGAKYIYDTDDDNHPTDSLRSFDLADDNVSNVLVVQTPKLTYNPYPHFGQRTLWPRGFPLDRISGNQPREYLLCQMVTPALRQGLVNGDPDVDAIYRLTRKHPAKRINLLFDGNAPRVVPPVNTFSPYNSQNTISTYNAFWALAFPVTPHLRVCDIWRSYWAQRLFWLIGEHIGFYTAGTFQFRSPHSYLKDFKNEGKLYHQATDLVDFLSQWQCQRSDFLDCVRDLSFAMVPKGFWEDKDAKLVDAWLSDLVSLGYKFPQMRQLRETLCLKPPSKVIYYPQEQKTSFGGSTKYFLPNIVDKSEILQNFVHARCPKTPKVHPRLKADGFSLVNDILLIVCMRNPPTIESLGRIEAYYRPRFSQIVYCGSWHEETREVYHHWQVSFLDVAAAKDPTLTCLLKAAEMHYLVKGYLIIQQDMLINVDTILNKNRNSTWSTKDWLSTTLQSQCQEGSNCLREEIRFSDVNSVVSNGKQNMDLYFERYQNCTLYKPGFKFTYRPDSVFYVSALFNQELRHMANVKIRLILNSASVFAFLQCSSHEPYISLSNTDSFVGTEIMTDLVEKFDFNNLNILCPLLGYDF